MFCFLLSVPIDSFTAIDRYFAAFVCATYLLFTAILSINIFIGLISNALQTEAFSTVEARFLLERIEVILSYEWRFSKRRRAQIQEIIHRYCAPLQLNWKDINFDAYGRSREEQQSKTLLNFRQTIEKQGAQFDTFRVQLQQKLNDIDTSLMKIQIPSRRVLSETSPHRSPIGSRRASAQVNAETTTPGLSTLTVPPTISNQNDVLGELMKLRELLEETVINQMDRTNPVTRTSRGSITSSTTNVVPAMRSATTAPIRQQLQIDGNAMVPIHLDQPGYPTDLSERVTDLQLAVNRLHQDVSAIRQVIERISPLSASLIIGRAAAARR